MGCSNSSSEKNGGVISPVPTNKYGGQPVKPAVPEFDDYAANKYGLSLEIQ
jgi:hypothetical protein